MAASTKLKMKVSYLKGLSGCFNNPAGNYMIKINNRNTKIRCGICSKLTLKTPERRQWRRSGVFNNNFEHISHLVIVFISLTLCRQMPAGKGEIDR